MLQEISVQMFPSISIQVKAPFTFGSTPDLWFTLTREGKGGGGGERKRYTPMKVTEVSVGKFREHP